MLNLIKVGLAEDLWLIGLCLIGLRLFGYVPIIAPGCGEVVEKAGGLCADSQFLLVSVKYLIHHSKGVDHVSP
jgi:hypothetical protein